VAPFSKASAGDADLARAAETAADGAGNGRFEVRIGQHQHRILAAQFERAAD
jgi:hypothetical protein